MSWLQWLLWACTILLVILMIALSVVPAIFVRKGEIADVTTRIIPGSPGNRTLIVLLSGLNGHGSMQHHNVLGTLLKRGDLLAVHYEGDLHKAATKFDPFMVVNRTHAAIVDALTTGKYSNVVFFGTSLGGKFAYWLAVLLLFKGGIYSKAILVDSPLKRRNLQFPINYTSLAMFILPYIPGVNMAFHIPRLERWVMEQLVIPPTDDSIEASLDREEHRVLDATIEMARQTRLNFYRGQTMFTNRSLRRIGVPLGLGRPWTPADVVIVRSTKDTDVVRESAYKSWARLFKFTPVRHLAVGAKHAAYGENPRPYRLRLPQAFDALGIPEVV